MCVVILNGTKDDALKQGVIVGWQSTTSSKGVNESFSPRKPKGCPFRSPLDDERIVHRSFTLKKGITKHDALQNQIKNRKDI